MHDFFKEILRERRGKGSNWSLSFLTDKECLPFVVLRGTSLLVCTCLAFSSSFLYSFLLSSVSWLAITNICHFKLILKSMNHEKLQPSMILEIIMKENAAEAA